MKLHNRTLDDLSKMICGAHGSDWGYSKDNFPYRTGSELSKFFEYCDMGFRHDGSTRDGWVKSVLQKINDYPSSNPHLPSNGIIRVIKELMDPSNFEKLDKTAALEDLNRSLGRDGLKALFEKNGECNIIHMETKVNSFGMDVWKRGWTREEKEKRKQLNQYLDDVSEDQLIEEILIPLFEHLGFLRITPSGHVDKSLEYGKDIWMKYSLPTLHFIYFGIQVKKNKIDSSARSKNQNISEILAQIRMMIDNPIWDPEINKKVFIDHVLIISAHSITKQARNWLSEHLDKEGRRHILYIDRDDLLKLSISVNLDLPSKKTEFDIDELFLSDEESDLDTVDLPF